MEGDLRGICVGSDGDESPALLVPRISREGHSPSLTVDVPSGSARSIGSVAGRVDLEQMRAGLAGRPLQRDPYVRPTRDASSRSRACSSRQPQRGLELLVIRIIFIDQASRHMSAV